MQAIFFQFGGITSLGVNIFNMAAPAVVVYLLFKKPIKGKKRIISIIASFLAGSLSMLLSTLLVSFSLLLTGKAFTSIIKLVVVAHIPLMISEGLITAVCIEFIKKTRPQILS